MTDDPYKSPEKENWIPEVPTRPIYVVVFLIIFTITGFALYQGNKTYKSAQQALNAAEAAMRAQELEDRKKSEIE